jgi:hypothetical protein
MGIQFHLVIIVSRWIELSKTIEEVPPDFAGGDGEKTLGQAEHSFVLWHKRYIIIPSAAARVPSPPPQLPHDRCG